MYILQKVQRLLVGTMVKGWFQQEWCDRSAVIGLLCNGKTPLLNERLVSQATRGAIMSTDSLSKQTDMTSSGDDFYGRAVTSTVVIASKVDV